MKLLGTKVEENKKKCLFPVHVFGLAGSETIKQKQTIAQEIVALRMSSN
jgi:hypothetical protein